jgi:serine/threonine protein kinase
MYTPGFAAPELYTKGALGPWTDIYSIGAAIYACMAGAPPQRPTSARLEDKMDGQLRQAGRRYSPELVAMVRPAWRSIRWRVRKACSRCRRCCRPVRPPVPLRPKPRG